MKMIASSSGQDRVMSKDWPMTRSIGKLLPWWGIGLADLPWCLALLLMDNSYVYLWVCS